LQSNLVISKALLDAGADILAESSSGQTAILFCAASFLPDQDVSRLLLSREPKLAAMESYWDSPFSAAVRNHDFSCARLLLEFGADPNQLLHGTSTTLFQVLAAEHDITAVRFLLSLPNISFNVSPRKQFTALHAPVVGRFRYNYFDEFELAGPGDVFKELLAKWQSREELEAREIRGYTALHFACLSRDVVATGLILRAMKRVGADVNIMTNLFWSPVWKTPLDLVEDRDRAPSPVVNRGAEAVERYNAKTADLRRMLTSAGGKHRAAALGNKWGSLSFVERIKAVLLSNRFTRPFAVVGEFFYTVWISGMDAFTIRMRFWAQSNPDEVQYRRH
jgi:ankyrin repeat protein